MNFPILGFRVGKSSEMKLLSPIIIEAISRQLKIFLLCGPNPEKSFPKNISQRPIKTNLSFPGQDKVHIVYYQNNNHLVNLLKNNKISDFFSLSFTEKVFEHYLKKIKKICKVHYLQATFDYLETDPSVFKQVDRSYMYSQEMINIYKKAYPQLDSNILNKFTVVGNPLYDTFSNINKKNIFKKFNFPANKKIVLLMSANMHTSFWMHYVFSPSNKIKATIRLITKGNIKQALYSITEKNYKYLVTNIKKWCLKNNALLIVKTKSKHKDPSYVKEIADFFFDDSSAWYPFITLELIVASDLIICFNYSTSSIDAVAANCPALQVTIKDPTQEIKFTDLPVINSRLYDYHNVNTIVNHRHLIKLLANKKISDFAIDKKSRHEFISKYLKPLDCKSSHRIIDFITKNM